VAAIAACQSSKPADDDMVGLVTSPKPDVAPIAVARAGTDAAELLRALALPHHRVSKLLGAHQVQGASKLEVKDLATQQIIETLSDVTVIEFDKDGNYKASLGNTRDYGRDAYFIGGTLYLRPRFGIFHKRPPTDPAEPARIRDDIYGTVFGFTEALQKNLAVSDGGSEAVGGRTGRKILLKKGATRTLPRESKVSRQWRDKAEVKDITGEVVLDVETGVPLKAHISGTIEFTGSGRLLAMKIDASHLFFNIGTTPAVTLPPTAEVMTPRQARDTEDRNFLLKGIAPPARRAPTPESVRLEGNPS
jgi:hypothetical protein